MNNIEIKFRIILLFALTVVINNVNAQILNIKSTDIVFEVDPNNTTSSDNTIFTSSGKLGIGVSSSAAIPATAKVFTNKGITYKDGHEADGAFLMSEADGTARWSDPGLIGRRVEYGAIGNGRAIPNSASAYTNITATPLILAGGQWLIVAKLSVNGTITASTTAGYVLLELYEEKTPVAGGASTYRSVRIGGAPHPVRTTSVFSNKMTVSIQDFISIPIELVPANTYKYYIRARLQSSTYSNAVTNQTFGTFTIPHQFFAIKLQ